MKKWRLFAITFLIFIVVALQTFAVSAVLVGVKKGDWIEYQVSVTGTPPEGHDAKWAKMEVVQVQGNALNLNVTTQFTNGSYLFENINLNLETGQLGDDFFIPANLNVGDVFFDAHAGNITISGTEQKVYAGSERTAVIGNTLQTRFYWDQQTGILVEAHSEYPSINFAMTTFADKTNIWQPRNPKSPPLVIYAVIAAVVVAAIVIAVLVTRSKRAS